MSELLHDATRECAICGLPMFPLGEAAGLVTVECANRHQMAVALPTDPATRERVRGWIARRGAQLHVQHERWDAEREEAIVQGASARLIRPQDRHLQTDQTAGMIREEAVRTSAVWAGVVRTEPGRYSAWHHHGDHESVIFIVSGTVRFEYGPDGKTMFDARPGDTIYVPAREVHREGNPGADESEIVVVRSGAGELVVNVAGPSR